MATSGFFVPFLCRFSGVSYVVSCTVFWVLRGLLWPMWGAAVRYLKKILLCRQKNVQEILSLRNFIRNFVGNKNPSRICRL